MLSNQAPPSWGGTVAVLHPLFYGKFAPQTSILLNFVPFPILSLFQLHSKRANPPHAKRGGFSCFPIRLRLLGEGQSLSFTPFPMGSLHRKLLFCLTSYLFLFYLYSSSTPSAPNPHAKRGGFLAFQSGSAFLGRDSRCPSPPFLWEVCTANFYRPACFQYQKSTQKCGFLLTSRTKYRRFFFSRRAKTPRKIWGFFPFKR